MCRWDLSLPFGTRNDAFGGPLSAELANKPKRMAEPRTPGGAVSSGGSS